MCLLILRVSFSPLSSHLILSGVRKGCKRFQFMFYCVLPYTLLNFVSFFFGYFQLTGQDSGFCGFVTCYLPPPRITCLKSSIYAPVLPLNCPSIIVSVLLDVLHYLYFCMRCSYRSFLSLAVGDC